MHLNPPHEGQIGLNDVSEALGIALSLVLSGNADLVAIVGLSLHVSLVALFIASLIGLPLGAALAVLRFPGRGAMTVVLSALMGLPPVVVGLFVYLMLSNSGPFGWMQLLYTPTAMIVAQCILITPIIAALTRQIIADLHEEYRDQFRSLNVPWHTASAALIWDARFSLLTVALAGFGRAIAEVGAVIIVGGNIDHLTRVMTTAIALETAKGDLALALALGIVLLLIALTVNAAAMTLRGSAARTAYA